MVTLNEYLIYYTKFMAPKYIKSSAAVPKTVSDFTLIFLTHKFCLTRCMQELADLNTSYKNYMNSEN